MTLKAIFLSFFLSISTFVFSQQKENLISHFKEIKNKSNQFINEPYFYKAQLFFLEKKWDSTLVYSMKQLSITTKNKELQNYCYYFRSYSFYQKNILKEAQKEVNNISNNFEFYFSTRVILGAIALEQKEFQKAISYFNELEELNTPELFGIKTSNLEHNIGISYLHLKKFDKAELYLLKSSKTQEKEKER
jgi:tetratricopeptide (TPR) repeat protein